MYSCEWPFYLRHVQQVRSVSQGLSWGREWEEQKSIKTAKQPPEKLATLWSDREQDCKVEETHFFL